jgi:hypothetical protein
MIFPHVFGIKIRGELPHRGGATSDVYTVISFTHVPFGYFLAFTPDGIIFHAEASSDGEPVSLTVKFLP